ncbi:Ankyrin repeat-containing domain superfamily [Arabidopsis suecica]|uniref:Ankyrin repeat-containing domain superfamily n=1 Tax=Arabidopsis suecica TaxID=45249 RepID=A0A8T2H0R9_ARASU|nr:Ankyrin repeat-containing domain superfamily [Arabidopsis suecica]
MKCDIKSEPGITSPTGFLSNPNELTISKDNDDEAEIMNPGILCAVRAGDKVSLLKRIKDDVKVTQRLVDNQGNSILHIAAALGHVHIVEYIISKFPNLLQKVNLMGETALHVAARAGNLNIVEILVRSITESSLYDELIDAKSKNGDTALHAALKGKHVEVAFYLVSVKHDVSFDKNIDEVSPLYLAVEAGYRELVLKMLECSSSFPSKLASMLSGKSVIHAAMKANRRDILGIVLRQDPGLIELRNEEGRTCLSYGAAIGYYEGIRSILAEFDKAASLLCYVADDDGFTPIHMAAKEGHVRIIKEFLKHCPDSRELLNSQCQNILHVAAKAGKSKVVKYILKLDEGKRLMNEQDVDGNTPLHLASKHGYPMVVNMLTWNDGINLTTLNNDGSTALDIAETLKDNNTYVLYKRLIWMALVSAGAPNGPNPIPLNMSQSRKQNPERYKDSVNTLMVTATLVATVTFAAGLTLPGGYMSSGPDLGMAALVNELNFKVFLLFNNIAMCTSVITIMVLIWAQLGDALLTKKAFQLALPLLLTAIVSMMMASVAGITLVVSDLPWLSHLVLAIDSAFLVVLMLLIIPYAFSSTRQGFLRHIFYFPYFLMLLVVNEESNNMDGLVGGRHLVSGMISILCLLLIEYDFREGSIDGEHQDGDGYESGKEDNEERETVFPCLRS